MNLPSPTELEHTCKCIAVLDAIISEEWEFRYYSFQQAWAKRQRMASMRNGSGDEWFIVFTSSGTFIKTFWHECKRGDVAEIYEGIPKTLLEHVSEPAFSMDYVTAGGWHDGKRWTLRGNWVPMKEELVILSGKPRAYRSYAADYFEIDVPLAAIEHVFAGKPIDAKLVASINDDRLLASVKKELREIGYP
jgi:hypothetical protein